jgi:adenosylcobyric acid synthase
VSRSRFEGKAKVLMVQGTMSSAGKSVLVAALCRIFCQDGLRVAPFKAQNMALNSFATREGEEMGRAQVMQAEAAMVEPSVDMNPILLKPETDATSQVIVMGKPTGSYRAGAYYRGRDRLWNAATAALERLRARFELVVIEGAGSPAEVNLRHVDIVNMSIARFAQAPVLLIGDIDRGGVFAQLVGTLALLEPEERALLQALVINKFRGDLNLLEPGLRFLQQRTGLPVAGVIPYFKDIRLPNEDSIDLEEHRRSWRPSLLDVVVIGLPHIANFDDFDPIEQEPSVCLRYVLSLEDLGSPDLIIIPGSKTTVADLEHLQATGIAQAIIREARRGTPIIGICGGYQMLGCEIHDPHAVESTNKVVPGLGLLPVSTVFASQKATHQVKGTVAVGRGLLAEAGGGAIEGYEIHMGSSGGEGGQPAFHIDRRSDSSCDAYDGCLGDDGLILGTYIHGLFQNQALRQAILGNVASRKGVVLPPSAPFDRQAEYDKLADLVRHHLDMQLIYRIVEHPEMFP